MGFSGIRPFPLSESTTLFDVFAVIFRRFEARGLLVFPDPRAAFFLTFFLTFDFDDDGRFATFLSLDRTAWVCPASYKKQ